MIENMLLFEDVLKEINYVPPPCLSDNAMK